MARGLCGTRGTVNQPVSHLATNFQEGMSGLNRRCRVSFYETLTELSPQNRTDDFRRPNLPTTAVSHPSLRSRSQPLSFEVGNDGTLASGPARKVKQPRSPERGFPTELHPRSGEPVDKRGLRRDRMFSPRFRVLKLHCFGFSPQRGSPKLAQGKRPTGAPPWVETVTGFEALKGRP